MHTYKKGRDGLWTVGYYVLKHEEAAVCGERGAYHTKPARSYHEWVALADTDEEMEAVRMVNYLNGGSGAPWVPFAHKKS